MNCPKCNFAIPDTMLPYRQPEKATILKKKKLVFEIGEGDNKKIFTVIEPTNAKRDEYIEITTEMARQDADKREAIKEINEKIAAFSYPEEGVAEPLVRDAQEIARFKEEIEAAMEKVQAMPTPSDRTALEFFLGKIDDAWYEAEMAPSIVEKIIIDCENELCNLDTVRKNMENLLPQTILLSSKALKR